MQGEEQFYNNLAALLHEKVLVRPESNGRKK